MDILGSIPIFITCFLTIKSIQTSAWIIASTINSSIWGEPDPTSSFRKIYGWFKLIVGTFHFSWSHYCSVGAECGRVVRRDYKPIWLNFRTFICNAGKNFSHPQTIGIKSEYIPIILMPSILSDSISPTFCGCSNN